MSIAQLIVTNSCPTIGRQQRDRQFYTWWAHRPWRAGEATLAASEKIATDFKAFINEAETNYTQQVMKPTFLQRFLGWPPEAAGQHSIFLHDFKFSFTAVMLYGHEVQLLVLELLLLVVFDVGIGTPNAVVAGCLAYAVSRAVKAIRAKLGEWNIARKSLVDDKFLL